VLDNLFDVVIAGAGLAGTAMAAVLGRQGWRVALVDPYRECKPAFKAEKIEPDQAMLFRQLSLLGGVLPHAARIESVAEAHRGRTLRIRPIEQYGIRYQDMVNAVRAQIPSGVTQIEARVEGVETSDTTQRVLLGEATLSTRLFVMACGTGGALHKRLELDRHMFREAHSLCSGFDVRHDDESRFSSSALTYWSERRRERVGYVTFFPMPGVTRVNLFSYREARAPWVHELAQDPVSVIARAMPRLTRVTGPWQPTSKVESRPIDLYSVREPERDGMVLVGDSFQSVCPATGTGVSKVLTDVAQLCLTHIPDWLRTPGMSAQKVSQYYADPVKQASDRRSLKSAEHERHFATDASLRWRLHREKTFAKIALAGLGRRHAAN